MPLAANQINGHTTTRDPHGVAMPNVTLTFQLTVVAPDQDSNYSTRPFTATSDGNGSLDVALVKGAGYQVKRGKKGNWSPFTAPPTGTTFELPEVIGEP